MIDFGGAGLDANYGISDSKDITQYTDATTLNISPNYNALVGINNVNTKNNVDIDWKKHLDAKQASLYSLYKKNPEIVSNPFIINGDIYKLIEKGGN